jgi:hypothetical protein
VRVCVLCCVVLRVRTSVRVLACMRAYARACVRMCVHVCVCARVCMRAYVFASVRVLVCARARVCVRVCAFFESTYSCVRAHAHASTAHFRSLAMRSGFCGRMFDTAERDGAEREGTVPRRAQRTGRAVKACV